MAITASDFSVAVNGDLRSIAGTGVYTLLELHEWLQDMADNAAAAGDDNVSILGPNPSELAGKRNAARPMAITLLNGVNVDDTASRRFKFGSIEQAAGTVLYTGLKTIGTIPGDASIYVVQNNAKLAKWWPNGPVQTLVKAKSGGAFIAGNTVAGVGQAAGSVSVFAREYGRRYSHFDCDLTPGSEQQAALSVSADPNINLTAGQAQTRLTNDITIAIGDTTQSLGGVSKLYKGTITLANGISVAQAYQALQWACCESSSATINGEPGWRYRKLLAAYAENQEAPFGSFAGGKWFVAQGWWVTGVGVADSLAYQLTSHDGTIVTPPNQVAFGIGNLVVGDRVLAGKDDGAGGFVTATGITATGTAGQTTVTLSGAPEADVPTGAGYIRIAGNAHSYTGISGVTVSGLSPAVPGGNYAAAAVWFPYIDCTADATSEASGSFNFGAAFIMRYRVRNGAGGGAIVPFESTAAVAGSNVSVNAVRTADV